MDKTYIKLTARQFIGILIMSLGVSFMSYGIHHNQQFAFGVFGNAFAGLMVIWGKN